MFGWTELLLVLLIVLLVFGASRLPEIARSLGSSVNEFKEGLETGNEETLEEENEDSSQAESSEDQKQDSDE